MLKTNQLNVFINNPNSRIIVFGATGWLGRECLNLFIKYLEEDFDSRFTFVSSKPNKMEVNGASIKVIGIDELPQNSKFDLLIDFSFITQDKMNQMGEKEYILQNNRLSQKIENFISETRPKLIYYASSGAANPDFLARNTNKSKKVYGELKAQAENRLEKIATEIGSKLILNRIWSITGRSMLEPAKYAIGDFVLQALKNNKININSSDQIYRTYIDAIDLLDSCLNYLVDGNSGLLNSGGEKISLFELTNAIYRVRNISETIIPNNIAKKIDDDYYSPDFRIKDIADKYGIKIQNIDQQIENTFLAINS